MKRRKTPPPKWQPPPGKMLFYHEIVPIGTAELHAKLLMAGFDDLPRKTRDRINDGDIQKRRTTKWKPTS